MKGLSALQFYRIRRRLRAAQQMLLTLRNDIEPIEPEFRDLLETVRNHVAQIEELWERKNIWKRILQGRA